MSILFSSDNGWIISHLDYLNSIYQNVLEGGSYTTLNFNKALFNINSQFRRKNQIDKYNSIKDNVNNLRKRKKKHLQTLPKNILQQNNFVKEKGKQILESSKSLKLFVNKVSDNNEESRSESKNFYQDMVQSVSNYFGKNDEETAIIAEFHKDNYVFPRNCKFYCYNVKEINNKMDFNDKFDFVLLDPPWWNKSIRRKKFKFEEGSYKMMDNKELAEIPVKRLLNSNGIVAVWCTNSPTHVKSILEDLFPAWGVIYQANWYWLKVTQNGETICDFNETHGKQPYEQIVIGSVNQHMYIKIPDHKIIISVPSAVHSHKPPIIEILKLYLPKQPKCIEIFARYLLPGWTSWGLEVLKFQHLSLYSSVEK